MSKSTDKNSAATTAGAEPGQESSGDPFLRGRKYPDAASVFKHTGKNPAQMKDRCLVVLDTNALLVPYSTGKTNLASIADVYRRLVGTGRLVVPGQVAREFADNRAKKLAELFQQISIKASFKFPKSDPHPLLDKEPAYLELVAAEKKLREYAEEYHKIAGRLLKAVGDWAWNDPVSSMYSSIIVGEIVVDPPFDHKVLLEDLEYRSRHCLPPGYKDAHKTDSGVGDLLIWKTILHIAAERKSDVLFVTLDGKSDWWHRGDGRTVYPRYELVDEFWVASGGCTFAMCKLSELLELFGATGDAVKETKLVEEQDIDAPAQSDSSLLELIRRVEARAAGLAPSDETKRERKGRVPDEAWLRRNHFMRVMSDLDRSKLTEDWPPMRGPGPGSKPGRAVPQVFDAEVVYLDEASDTGSTGQLLVHRLLDGRHDVTYLLGERRIFSGTVELQRYLERLVEGAVVVIPCRQA